MVSSVAMTDASAALPQAAMADNARILVVDDDDRNLFAIGKVVEGLGQVVGVRSGEEALKYLLESDCAVILLDVFMPTMDGYETAALIRARERSRHIPIIFLTAVNKDVDHLLRGYAMGAVDYVFKPVEPAILKSKVAVFVELFNMTQEIRRKAEREQRLLAETWRARTEKIEAEQALLRSEERQAVIVRSLPLVLYAGAPGAELGPPQFISDNVESICGFGTRDFLERGLWAARIHPDDRERVLRQFAELSDKGFRASEYRWQHADGEYRVFLDQSVLVRDPSGGAKEVVGTLLDVTDQRRIEQQLIQAQKMDAIGKLTGGIAHDFNNMLTVVIGSLDRLKRGLKDDAALRKRVDLALEGALRCSDLTRQLLTFARRQSLQPQSFDLNSAVSSVVDMVRRVLGEGIELELDCAPSLWQTHADPTQTESALLNLVVNARDAMPSGGRLTISTRNVAAAELPAVEGRPDSGEFVALTVADTGSGIPASIRERVFDPFFTTKADGKGTGLGLSIIYGFVKQSGGHIWLESEVGRGTEATIFLPRARGEGAAAAPDAGELPVARARPGEVVLVVEDDKAVRQLALETLRELGYGVLEAENGPTALDLLTRGGRIDLLFTDLAMPGGLNGDELAREAGRRRPELRVLLTSAHTDQLLAHTAAMDLGALNKPYRDHELASAVRGMLDG